ncbi:MAG: hypothetical protein RL416_563 [Pseudomonadota bacterium]
MTEPMGDSIESIIMCVINKKSRIKFCFFIRKLFYFVSANFLSAGSPESYISVTALIAVSSS